MNEHFLTPSHGWALRRWNVLRDLSLPALFADSLWTQSLGPVPSAFAQHAFNPWLVEGRGHLAVIRESF